MERRTTGRFQEQIDRFEEKNVADGQRKPRRAWCPTTREPEVRWRETGNSQIFGKAIYFVLTVRWEIVLERLSSAIQADRRTK